MNRVINFIVLPEDQLRVLTVLKTSPLYILSKTLDDPATLSVKTLKITTVDTA